MKYSRSQYALFFALTLAANAYALPKWFHGKKHGKQNVSATVTIVSGVDSCKVDVDGEEGGTTASDGSLMMKDVEPGDHYVHVQCPNQRETSYFISPAAGSQMELDARGAATNSHVADSSPTNPAASEMELRHIVSQADQLRSSGNFKEAVELLRKAAMLDPRNGDLHRELGITFLMFHDWESARIEMLEAVRREPENVDAHSSLAYALEKLGDLDEALKQYKICTQMDPHDTSYRDHYVQVLGQLYAERSGKKH
ncbi:MAG TPA: tetratricopeptide repeat protein [Terriglobia bacterium]|nr:tetratricopeptide repeat protein [Terriglobia bacterium]